jgi:hypothetical protein
LVNATIVDARPRQMLARSGLCVYGQSVVRQRRRWRFLRISAIEQRLEMETAAAKSSWRCGLARGVRGGMRGLQFATVACVRPQGM